MGSIRLGLIGCGGIAGAHAEAVATLRGADGGGVTIAAVVDPVAEARLAMAGKTSAKAFPSMQAMLKARSAGTVGVDAVVLCVPPSGRVPLVEAALGAGLAVLAEKPLGHTAAEAAALVALAEAHRELLTAVAYCHRFTPALMAMKRLLHVGKIGTPIRFENHFACWHPTLQGKWMSDPAVSGGGSLVDTGCHSLDLLGFIADGLDRVNVRTASLHHGWPGRGDTNATLVVEAKLEQGTIPGIIHAGWCEADRFTVSITGTHGTLAYDFLDQPEVLRFTPSHLDAGSPESIAVENHGVRFAKQLEAFAAAYRDQSQAGMHTPYGLASFGEAAIVARLVQDAYARANVETLVPMSVDPVVVADADRVTPGKTKKFHTRKQSIG